jgi:hypothetical protein
VPQVLREDHFSEDDVRQRLREVALMVTDRITSGAIVPIGSAAKALDNIKVKVRALQLPPRPEGVPAPLARLLTWAAQEDA